MWANKATFTWNSGGEHSSVIHVHSHISLLFTSFLHFDLHTPIYYQTKKNCIKENYLKIWQEQLIFFTLFTEHYRKWVSLNEIYTIRPEFSSADLHPMLKQEAHRSALCLRGWSCSKTFDPVVLAAGMLVWAAFNWWGQHLRTHRSTYLLSTPVELCSDHQTGSPEGQKTEIKRPWNGLQIRISVFVSTSKPVCVFAWVCFWFYFQYIYIVLEWMITGGCFTLWKL